MVCGVLPSPVWALNIITYFVIYHPTYLCFKYCHLVCVVTVAHYKHCPEPESGRNSVYGSNIGKNVTCLLKFLYINDIS